MLKNTFVGKSRKNRHVIAHHLPKGTYCIEHGIFRKKREEVTLSENQTQEKEKRAMGTTRNSFLSPYEIMIFLNTKIN